MIMRITGDMSMLRTLVAMLATIVLGTTAFAGGWPGMNRQIDETNFVVNVGCSGTLIDVQKRYVLTANHCVENQYETVERENIDDKGVVTKERVRRLKPGTVKQIFFNGASEVREVTYRTRIVAVDKDKDLALVHVLADLPNKSASRIACTDTQRGDSVFVVGNPAGVLYASVIPGMVSSVQRDYGILNIGDAPSESLLQISGGIVGGNSGGAVYNTAGELIGVPVLANRVNEVIAFAVPLSAIKEFLTKNGAAAVFAYCKAGK